MKFKRNIYKANGYLAVVEKTIGIFRVEVKFCDDKKWLCYTQIGHKVIVRSENIKPYRTVTPNVIWK